MDRLQDAAQKHSRYGHRDATGAHIGRKNWRDDWGKCVRKTAAKFEVNPSTVQRIARPFVARVAGAA